MQIQNDNKLISSFMLFIDHTVIKNGRAFTNSSGSLFPVNGHFTGLNIYTSPYRQLVNDVSITGVNIMSGVWVNSVFTVPTGGTGLNSINITEGQAYFTNSPSSVSGRYAVKDFSVYLTDRPEEEILFETKLVLRNSAPQTVTGLAQNDITYPALYIKNSRSENTPFCLGGIDNNEQTMRVIVLGDSQFLTDAACSILKNTARKKFKIIEPSGIPLNAYGAMTGVNYNYDSLASGSSQESIIWRVRCSNLLDSRELNSLNPAVFAAFVDFDLWTIYG